MLSQEVVWHGVMAAGSKELNTPGAPLRFTFDEPASPHRPHRHRHRDQTSLSQHGTSYHLHHFVGPKGSYLTAWCHLRREDRVFRMDRITKAERTPILPHRPQATGDLHVDGFETKLPAVALHPEDLFPTPT